MAIVQEAEPREVALTLMDGMSVDRVTQMMQTIQNFQRVIQTTLREGHDYGRIPGAGDKPTLLKPGAEKILMIMGVTSEYEIAERTQDYDTGFFAYTVRCRLSRGGLTITEGVGNCNSREKKYTSERQDKFVLANTCLKMAKKRAQVDAALTIGSLSDLFTQDIEDMSLAAATPSRPAPSRPKAPAREDVATDKQLDFLRKKADAKDLTAPELAAWVHTETGKAMDKLTKREASTLIDALGRYTPPESEHDPFEDGEPLDFIDGDLSF